MIILHNPFQDVIHVTKKLYKIDVEIYFDDSIRKILFWGHWGETCFPDKGAPVIYISSHLSVHNALEILAHELSHVVVGYKEGHNKKWEKVFSKIHKEYNKYLKNNYIYTFTRYKTNTKELICQKK